MIQGKNINLKTVSPHEVELVYAKISDINTKGPYWHLTLQSPHDFLKDYQNNGFWGMDEGRMLVMSKDEAYVGEILYFKGLDYQSGYEVGYELFDTAFAGKGYMSEALLLFCAYMFSIRPINRIQVNTMEKNTASQRVVEKCGFTYEGMMRKATFHKGEYHNLKLFSLLREECPSLESLLA